MDLIYTDANKKDLGVLSSYELDMSFGASDNDFELTLNSKDVTLEYGALVYIEGTEYGGIVDGKYASTDGDAVTYKGRSWHGILNGKIIEPPSGMDHLVVDDYVDNVFRQIFSGLGLADLFSIISTDKSIYVKNYTFNRYCKAYDAIRDMLSSFGAKLRLVWVNGRVFASAVPIDDYSKLSVDGDSAVLNAEHYENKVNHLICLGRGELSAREIEHLYIDKHGKTYIGTPHYTGIYEITDVYDNSNAETWSELVDGGTKRLEELRNTDKAEIFNLGSDERSYDIGDIVAAHDVKSGIKATAVVTQKIVKIVNGSTIIEYKTGG